MTEYGRGQGQEPWHPEDPLYGDRESYGEQGLHQAPPQRRAPYGNGPGGYGPGPGHDPGSYGPDAYGQAPYGQDSYGQAPYHQGAHPGNAGYPQDPYGHGPHGSQGHGGWQDDPQAYAAPGQYPGPGQAGGYGGDPYNPGTGRVPPVDPYAGQGGYAPQDTYAPPGGAYGPQDPQAGPDGYGMPGQAYGGPYGGHVPRQGAPQDAWTGTPDAPGQWVDETGAGQPEWAPAPGTEDFEDQPGAEPGPGTSPFGSRGDSFFDGTPDTRGGGLEETSALPVLPADGEDDADDGVAGETRKGRGGKKGTKRRSGCACLTITAVLVGGVGVVGYFGYQFYESHFAPAPDYVGRGSGPVQVVIPDGAGTAEMGRALQKAGVVKSAQAFVDAANGNPAGGRIQPGAYSMRRRMSGASAVTLMLDPKSRNSLTVPEGWRNAYVYKLIDTRLKLKPGTTAQVAKKDAGKLGLPSWADDNSNIKDPLEGFLYPSTYSVGSKDSPEDVLRAMVGRAEQNYEREDLKGAADKLHLKSPLQVVTVASLVQAEGKTDEDFRKMAEVVYNRLSPTNSQTNGLLQFDSTFNYLKNQSNIKISTGEINSNQDPYNTYTQKGLPPGPIDNPGAQALQAALNPTHDGWMYFVATDGMNKTEFARTHQGFLTLKEKFDASSGG